MAEDKIVNEAMKWYDKNVSEYKRCAKMEADLIEKILKRNKISYHSITFRIKDRESFKKKCEKEKYVDPVNEITDVAGIRIIAYTNKDVYDICNEIKNEFQVDEENSIDKANLMKEDQVGYRSVHYIVKLKQNRTILTEYEEYADIYSEIQVRTLLQHAWAEIEHDRNYKFSGVLPAEIRRRFFLVAGTLELIDREFDALSELIDEHVKVSKEKMSHDDYDIPLDTKTLEEYMRQKYKSGEYRKVITNEIVNELIGFGFTTIREIDEALTEDALKGATAYAGILRNMMIIENAKKYFEEAYNWNWNRCSREIVDYWSKKANDNIEKYLEENDITIVEK